MSRDGKYMVLVFLLVIIIFLVVNYNDEEVDREEQHYCEMVRLWYEYGHLPEVDRPGWPPFKGEEQCYGTSQTRDN